MALFHVTIFFLFVVGGIVSSSALIITSPAITYGVSANTTTTIPTTSMQRDQSCNNLYAGLNLWNHTYEHKRFTELKPDCITVKGTVITAYPPWDPQGEKDGDYHFNLQLDTAQYSNQKNCRLGQNPCKELIAEIVCFTHRDIDASHKDAAKACNGYDNKISAPPKKGQNVTVTGKWIIDNQGFTPHGWKEIHPVTKVTIP
jgi:hypothetical protein